jgi:hypothetical protein
MTTWEVIALRRLLCRLYKEVVGAGLERKERLQRRPMYLLGLHPPHGIPQRSQHVERIGLRRGHF